MQKPPEVPDRKPEKSGDTNLEGDENDLVTHFEICLAQILRVGRTRKRAVREQNEMSTGSAGD
jgi:hypothetical protein